MSVATLADYRRITRDMLSYDGEVLAELAAAQKIVEEQTDRKFESATRTETLYQYADGRVYPSALPLVSVSVPSGATIDGNSIRTPSVFSDITINSDYFNNTYIPQVTVTYIGGNTAGNFPQEIVRIICQIAEFNLVSNSTLFQVPAGATSIKTGDVQILGKNLGDNTDLPSSITRVLRTWKRRDVRGS